MTHLVVADQVGEDAPAWDALVVRQATPTPFSCSWWIDNASANPPVVAKVFDGPTLIGGFAMEVRGFAALQRFGLVGSDLVPDHLDLVAAPGAASEVVSTLAEWFRSERPWLADFNGVRPYPLISKCMGASVVEQLESQAPTVVLRGDYEEYLSQRPGATRSTVARSEKRLARAGFATRLAPPTERADAMQRLGSLHSTRWGEQSAVGSNWDRLVRVVTAAPAEAVRITELVDAHGVAIAAELDFVVGDRWCFYQAGRSNAHEHRGSGSVLRAAIIQAAYQEGVREFDLLRGMEGYKAEWANGARPVARVRAGAGLRGLAIHRGLIANQRVAAWRANRSSES